MKLYEFPPTRSIRVRWTLQELEVPFEAVFVDMRKGEHLAPAYRAVNPAGKLPALVDGDVVLTESVAIVVYLADRFPAKRLMPADLAQRAQAWRWLMFTATELEQPLWRIAKHTNLYPPERRNPAECELAREDFGTMSSIAEAHMKDREFVLGDAVSVADFVLAYTLDWANEVHLLDARPALQRYLAAMYRRPHAAPRIAAAFAQLRKR